MSNFVMVINSVTAEQLEKILGIQVRSENKLRFVPQGNQQAGQLSSPPLNQAQGQQGNPPKMTVFYNFVRLEWTEDATRFAEEVFRLFISHEHREQKAG